MIVRRERADDLAAVRRVHLEAFPTEVEADLLDELRTDSGWIGALSLVAEVDSAVVGHVTCTRGVIEESGREVLGLGPVGVRPDHQGQGAGTALVHAVVAVAEAAGEALVALLGDPGYYGRMGFRPASGFGVLAPEPDWGDFFQVRLLVPPSDDLAGTFAYAEPFRGL
jgi:putative acetyltransferase